MKASSPWITYRTRFLVKAKQLTTTLAFTDALGRQHSGRKGDYLVESADGVLRIAPRQIFEDIYVPLFAKEMSANEKLASEKLGTGKDIPEPPATFSLQFPLTRKSPQPYRDRRNPSPGLRSF
ncbi:MAG TPA: hypothetical protein VK722_04725 [Candidatus Aquilonibacter sp.]|jgi:hypothetical protein|nr:hypothetical protein [Candidatus Aquilonibacter sp.]